MTILIFTCLQSMVLDECSRLVAESSDKSQNKIEELNSEIRKLKAMIGKSAGISQLLIIMVLMLSFFQ